MSENKEVKKLAGLVEDMSSDDYHSHPNTFSSSQLKTILEDPEIFHRKYIAKTEEKVGGAHFDVGTYFHTAILEPHKIKSDCAVYEGIRRGKDWDKFQIDNKGKCIVTKSEMEQAEGLVRAVKDSPVAMGRLSRGRPEVSAFVDVSVSCGDIFAAEGDKVLGKYGWETSKGRKVNKKKCRVIALKVRADLLGESFILDLKSTTGNAKDERTMRASVSKYSYDLSAALYLDMFSIATEREMSEFIWTFASKDHYNSRSYIASEDNVRIGRAKWRKAVLTLSDFMDNNWTIEDSMGILNPNIYEVEWIKEKVEDLL